LRPYKITIAKDNYFEFTTVAGIKYACYFLSYAEYFKDYKEIAGSIYSFNVEVLESKRKGPAPDERAGLTIVDVVKQFLEELENAVVYVCDTSDGRELVRKRKFDNWFKKYDDGTIIKVDGHIAVPNFNIYNTILIHKDNPKKNLFIKAFNDLNSPGHDK
jgi:hypothetical protein